jgi:hypothetical protein
MEEYPMKIALAFALILASSTLVIGLASTDADAGGRKFCKQALKTHPMAGEHHDLMKQCRAAYKAHRKAGYPRPTPPA